MSENREGPADTIRDGNIKATIWKRESDEGGAFFSTTFARSYKDAEGNYRDSNSFGSNDLLRLAELARGAYTRTQELRRDSAPSRDSDEKAERRERFSSKRRSRVRDQNWEPER